ncbi:MAG: HAMP domain-containing sensor histidine kinase [Blastocatellia bacterium]
MALFASMRAFLGRAVSAEIIINNNLNFPPPLFQSRETMTENGLPLMVLCHFDGRVATADQEAIALLGNPDPMGEACSTISQIAEKANCAELSSLFERFIVDGQASAVAVASFGDRECQVTLRRLNGFQTQPLVAVEMRRFDKEQSAMAEIGRATNRLIHDFKNQIGGLKLYAAYLKKRFARHEDWADWTEGLEITDKIIQSLNEMTANASLVTKLTRPLELRLIEEDFVPLVKQALDEFQPQAAARGVKVNAKFAVTQSRFPLDSQQMREALNTLLVRAADLSAAGGTVNVVMEAGQAGEGQLLLSISNEGEVLSEQQRQAFFDFLTNERLNQTSLKMALARRIIELHGGQAAALAAKPAGTNILLTF